MFPTSLQSLAEVCSCTRGCVEEGNVAEVVALFCISQEKKKVYRMNTKTLLDFK
jgi:hypothetical protein